jgi:O-antigen/teichoic acid export membrane protein
MPDGAPDPGIGEQPAPAGSAQPLRPRPRAAGRSAANAPGSATAEGERAAPGGPPRSARPPASPPLHPRLLTDPVTPPTPMPPVPPAAAPTPGGAPVPEATVEPEEAGERGAPAPRRSRSVARGMAVTFTSNVGVLAMQLFTGVLTARALDPDGRGEVAAVTSWALTAQIIAMLGAIEGVTYVQSRRPQDSARVLGTTLALVLVLGSLGLLIAELLLPVGLAAQSDDLIAMGRLAIVMMVPVMAFYACNALYNAHQRFTAAAVARLAQALLMAIWLGTLAALGRLTVGTALLAHTITWTTAAVVSVATLWRWYGLSRPDGELARESMRFGIRAYGESFGSLVNARLDLMLMPALVAPDQIGLYVVAVSAAGIVMPLFAQLRNVVFAVAAGRERASGFLLVERTLRVALVGSSACAVGLAVFGRWLVTRVWGADFADAVTPMRILLPGLVMWTAAAILTSGLKAAGRPTGTSGAQFAGMVVTVVGLVTLLPTIGIDGAAVTSSVAYTTVFVVNVWLLASEDTFSLRRALAPRQFLADARWVRSRLAARLPRAATTGSAAS